MKSFSSLAGDDSELLVELRTEENCKSRNCERDWGDGKAKTMKGKGKFSSNDLDFGKLWKSEEILENEGRSSKTSIRVSKDTNGNEVIEIELNDSYVIPPDVENSFSPVNKLLIIGINNCNFYKNWKPAIIAQYPTSNSKKLDKNFSNLIYAWFPNDIEIEIFYEK